MANLVTVSTLNEPEGVFKYRTKKVQRNFDSEIQFRNIIYEKVTSRITDFFRYL